MVSVGGTLLLALVASASAQPLLLLPTPPFQPPAVWTSAVRLRNGNSLFISNTTELAVVNNNLYVFDASNLYYYNGTDTIFLTYLIPRHKPLGVFAQQRQSGIEGTVEGIWVTTGTCVLKLRLPAPAVVVVTGNCYEDGQMRDGPQTFARYNLIQGLASACSSTACAILLLDTGTRLCLLVDGVVASITWPSPIVAISMVWEEAGGWVVAVGDGLAVTCFSWQQGVVRWRSQQQAAAIAMLDAEHLFMLQHNGAMYRLSSGSSLSLGRIPFLLLPSSQLDLDLPSGMRVMDPVMQTFYLAPNLGCLCPPGFSMLQVESTHCQPAPAGGYVDILGRFVACPPGTLSTLDGATSEQTCRPCPPSTTNSLPQSTMCQACRQGRPNPARTACIIDQCPAGTEDRGAEGCRTCPFGMAFEANACRTCPANTFTDPAQQVYACTACPGPSPPCPLPACLLNSSTMAVMTINVLGFQPVDMAVAGNGTVYIAGFQLLAMVDQSGSFLQNVLPALSLVRGIALSGDERVLYAAITEDTLLCLASVGHALTQWRLSPNVAGLRALVGVRAKQQQLAVWSAAANSLAIVGQGVVYRGDALNAIVAFAPTAQGWMLMLRHVALGNQSVVLLPTLQVVMAGGQPWNPFLVEWAGQLVLSSRNAILQSGGTLAGAGNLTGRVDAQLAAQALFTAPGPMVVAPDPSMLLVADQTGLRVLYRGGCRCGEDYYQDGGSCAACPVGLVSMQVPSAFCQRSIERRMTLRPRRAPRPAPFAYRASTTTPPPADACRAPGSGGGRLPSRALRWWTPWWHPTPAASP